MFSAFRVQKVLVFTALSAFFCIAPEKDVNTQKCCNFENLKIARKMCQNGAFFRFQVPSKRGRGMLLETLMSDPDSVQDFWCFSGPGVGGSAVWGAPHHRALVALGRS